MSSQRCPYVSASIMSTARFDLGLISTWSPEGILCQSISHQPKARDSRLCLPEDRVFVLDLRFHLVPVLVCCLGDVHCCKERCHQDPSRRLYEVPCGTNLEGSLVLLRHSNREVSGTYSATKPKCVVFRITAPCRLFIHRFQIPLWPERVGVFEESFVSQDIPLFATKRSQGGQWIAVADAPDVCKYERPLWNEHSLVYVVLHQPMGQSCPRMVSGMAGVAEPEGDIHSGTPTPHRRHSLNRASRYGRSFLSANVGKRSLPTTESISF